jgi:predicted DNA-binding protein (MmcQ/YjbR family)
MNIEELRKFCLSFKGATEDVKWGADLCFCIGAKMFCVTGFNPPLRVSLKVKDEEFDELCSREGIEPAAYTGRFKWIYVKDAAVFSKKEWEHYIRQRYELVKAKLPKKVLDSL